MVNSTLVIDTSMEAPEVILEQVLYIQYLVKFRKDKKTVWVSIDSSSKINAIILAYAAILDLKICPTAVKA